MAFLPADYKAPAGSSSFMKLQDGENRFRVLSDAKVGWEGWKDNKPFRREGVDCNIEESEVDTDSKYGKPKPKINHFWAFVVWDCQDKAVKILSLTQKTIHKAINELVEDKDWGDPKEYDLSIVRTKSGERVSYAVKSYPHKKLTKEQEEAFASSDIDLDSLFEDEPSDEVKAF